MHIVRSARALSGLCFVILTACGGGDGSDAPQSANSPPISSQPQPQPQPSPTPQPQPSNPQPSGPPPGSVSLAANSLTFEAPLRNATPANQTIAFTMDGVPSGNIGYKVEKNGRTVSFVEVLISGTGGQITFEPESSNQLNVGTNTDTITISFCLDDSACNRAPLTQIGRSQIVNVTYNVMSSVQGNTVSPRVGAANKAGDVIIRGSGFSNVSSVRFGTTPASAMRVVSDSEIRASYPALVPGRYSVAITGGASTFDGALTVVAVPSYSAASIAFPTQPDHIGGAIYDAERGTVLVAARYGPADVDKNQLIKFVYTAGQWSAAQVVPVPRIQDLVLSPNGRTLLVATDRELIEFDPVSLTPGNRYAPTDETFSTSTLRLHSLALANDGYSIVTTDRSGSGLTPLYLYSTQDHTFTATDIRIFNPVAGGSDSGVLVGITGTSPSSSSTPQYNASSQLISFLSNAPINNYSVSEHSPRPSSDAAGSILVVNAQVDIKTSFPFAGQNQIEVYDANSKRLGSIPGTSLATLVSPDGSRVYALNDDLTNPNELRTYDLTQPLTNGFFPQMGTGVPLAADPEFKGLEMLQTPDGGTLFFVGRFGLVVQPTPK